MRRLGWLVALVVATVGVAVGSPGDDDAWIAAQPPLHRIAHDRAAVDRLLRALQARFPDFHERLRAVVLLRLGTPYVLGCLGEEGGRDSGPIFRLDESDCTVHVLTSSALAHAASWADARRMMRSLNYYPGGEASYENRVHFTEDRLVSSPWFAVVPTTAPKESVTLVLNRKGDGTHVLDVPWEKPMTVRWIASAHVTPTVLAQLPAPVAGVAFVRRKLFADGMAVAHEGVIVDRRWLVHADSIGKKTARVDFLDYLRQRAGRFDGVIFFSFR